MDLCNKFRLAPQKNSIAPTTLFYLEMPVFWAPGGKKIAFGGK
jgi:hypothetical protein